MSDHKNINHKNRPGSSLEHGEAHKKDHENWSRRSFLRNVGLAGGMSMFVGNYKVAASALNSLDMSLLNAETDRILVIVRLKGGNDGLNMMVPKFDYGTYSDRRPTLRVPEANLIDLSDEIGMPNTMQALNPLWQEGKMKVINSVGYEDQNLSHFRSSDIWATASDSDEVIQSGWIGRLLDGQLPDFISNPPTIPPSIQIQSNNLIFQNEDNLSLGMSVADVDELHRIATTGSLHDVSDLPDCVYGEQLGYLRTITNTTFTFAESIKTAFDSASNSVTYGVSQGLGDQLAIVARLIKGNLGTKFYMVSIDGFDTHAEQANVHPNLLSALANEIANFFTDLDSSNMGKDVLCMTVSEFGRRTEENGSMGTDHGAAAPMMLFGEGLNGNGFLGGLPDLHDLDNAGNMKYDIDFRQSYASVLQNWLCIPADEVDGILGRHFVRLDALGLECMDTAVPNVPLAPMVSHRALYAGDGRVFIEYDIPSSGHLKIELFSLAGRQIATLYDGHQVAGKHKMPYQYPAPIIPSGLLAYRIYFKGQRYSGKIRVIF